MNFDFNILYLLISIATSAGVAWGVVKSKVKVLEEEVAILRGKHSVDHDLLIKIETKIDMLLGNIKIDRNEKK